MAAEGEAAVVAELEVWEALIKRGSGVRGETFSHVIAVSGECRSLGL